MALGRPTVLRCGLFSAIMVASPVRMGCGFFGGMYSFLVRSQFRKKCDHRWRPVDHRELVQQASLTFIVSMRCLAHHTANTITRYRLGPTVIWVHAFLVGSGLYVDFWWVLTYADRTRPLIFYRLLRVTGSYRWDLKGAESQSLPLHLMISSIPCWLPFPFESLALLRWMCLLGWNSPAGPRNFPD